MGVANVGTYNTGGYNVGSTNTGIANVGIANTGSYNTGSTNTGSFNDGDFNTGFYNTGDYNTGFYNTGDVNTGAFIGGNFSNGAFWQSDHQGQWGAHYAITVPQIPLLNFSLNIPVNIPIHLDFGTLAVNGFQIPAITLRALGVTHFSVGPIIVPRIAGTLPVIDINIGDPGGSSSIPITITSGAGPVVIPLLDIPPAPVSETRPPAPHRASSTPAPAARLDSETSAPTIRASGTPLSPA